MFIAKRNLKKSGGNYGTLAKALLIKNPPLNYV